MSSGKKACHRGREKFQPADTLKSQLDDVDSCDVLGEPVKNRRPAGTGTFAVLFVTKFGMGEGELGHAWIFLVEVDGQERRRLVLTVRAVVEPRLDKTAMGRYLEVFTGGRVYVAFRSYDYNRVESAGTDIGAGLSHFVRIRSHPALHEIWVGPGPEYFVRGRFDRSR